MKQICEIGCGDKRIFKDSICLDMRKTAIADLTADASRLPFKNASFDLVYSSHVLEHFSHRDVCAVLDEWIRVLKVGGTLELRCPDLRMRSLIFFFNPSWDNISNIYGEQNYSGNYHKSGFTFNLLKRFLIQKRIRSIKRVLDGYNGIPFIPCDLHIVGIKY